MRQYALLTAVGEDKPGLVDAVSKFILECGCNIEDSRMAALGGEFAMLILVTGESAATEKLFTGAVQAGQACGLALQVKRARAPGAAAPAGTIPYALDAYSLDHPGIVESIAGFLARRKINIQIMDTRLTNAPVTGLPLFSLHATVAIPAQESVAEIRRGLEAIGVNENIDIELKPAR